MNRTLNSRSIRTILFDIGKVIIPVDFKQTARSLARQSPFAVNTIILSLNRDRKWLRFQKGEITGEEWFRHLLKKFELNMSLEEFRCSWVKMLGATPLLENSLFETLAAQFQLGLISDTDPIHLDYLRRHYSFLDYFSIQIYSCMAGICKPSESIYRLACSKSRCPPKRILYIDDIEENCRAGRRAGLQVHQFRSARSVHSTLRNYGLLDWQG